MAVRTAPRGMLPPPPPRARSVTAVVPSSWESSPARLAARLLACSRRACSALRSEGRPSHRSSVRHPSSRIAPSTLLPALCSLLSRRERGSDESEHSGAELVEHRDLWPVSPTVTRRQSTRARSSWSTETLATRRLHRSDCGGSGTAHWEDGEEEEEDFGLGEERAGLRARGGVHVPVSPVWGGGLALPLIVPRMVVADAPGSGGAARSSAVAPVVPVGVAVS